MEGDLINSINLDGKGIFKIKTLGNISIYMIYVLGKTTLSAILKTFELNYSPIPVCVPFYNSETLKRSFVNEDYSKTPEELGLEKMEEITLSLNKRMYHKDGPKTICEKKLPYGFQIYVKTLTHTTMWLTGIEKNTTVENLKYKLDKLVGLYPDQQRLIFKGKQLEDSKTMEYYNIVQDDTLHLVLRLSGGMYHETSGKAGNYGELKSCIIYVDS